MRRHKRCVFNPWVRKIPWRRNRQPPPVFSPGKFHGQRSLEVYNPWVHIESNTTGCVHIHMYNNGFSSLSKNRTCRYLMKIIGNIILLIKVFFYKVKIAWTCFQSSCYCCLVAQSCSTLCDPMDCSPPGSSVHGIPQARIVEWVAISFSRGSSQLRDRTCISWVPCTGWLVLYHWATREAHINCIGQS